jgi:phosphinothricin acetyltransferase
MDHPHIRLATAADLEAINRIYNHYVLTSTCTYQTEPETAENRAAWFASHGPEHPITVAQLGQRVVGWGSLSCFHPRTGYRQTVENTIYVDHQHLRRGIGRALLADLIARAAQLGHHTIIGLIDADQTGSIALHAQLGFVPAGRLHEVGFKFGRWLDVCYMERLIRNN